MKTIHLTILIFAFMNVTAGPTHGQVQIAAKTIVEKSTVGKSSGNASLPAAGRDGFTTPETGIAGGIGRSRETTSARTTPQRTSAPENREQASPAPRQIADQMTPATYYDDLIGQNPETAALYLQKAATLIKNGAGPQVIINTLEEALKQEGLIGTNKEVAMVYNYLGDAYIQMDNIYSAVINYNKAHVLMPGTRLLVDYEVSGGPNPEGKFWRSPKTTD